MSDGSGSSGNPAESEFILTAEFGLAAGAGTHNIPFRLPLPPDDAYDQHTFLSAHSNFRGL